jgi:hypothetical protein
MSQVFSVSCINHQVPLLFKDSISGTAETKSGIFTPLVNSRTNQKPESSHERAIIRTFKKFQLKVAPVWADRQEAIDLPS